MRMRALFTLLSPFAFTACGSDSSTGTVSIEQTNFAASHNENLAASTKTADGLYYRDITVGTGATIVAGSDLNVKYSGALTDGTVFDAGTYAFRIPGSVIQGWNEGLLGMKVGGTRQLIIPPALGYGSQGAGQIPPNAVLVFTVQPI